MVRARLQTIGMARQLWLLRHAEAEPHGARADAERTLTARGERQARTVGVALSRLETSFEAVLFSPKVRARQTAELAAAEWNKQQRERLRAYPPLASGFDARQARAGVIRELAQIVKEFRGPAPVRIQMETSEGPRTLQLGPDFQVEPAPDFFAEVKALLGPAAVL